MADRVKNQHFIPQSYLNRFTENGRIAVFKKEDSTILSNQNPRNFASERYYYDVNENEWTYLIQNLQKNHPDVTFLYEDQPIEHFLSRVEADMKVLLDDIASNPDLLAKAETRIRMACFFHLASYRSKNYRDKIDRINKQTYDYVIKMAYTDDKRKWIEHSYGNGASKRQQLKMMIDDEPLAETYAVLENDYVWYWATAEKDGEFIVSDDFSMFFRTEAVELIFPVSLKNAIILRKTDASAPIMGTDLPNGNRIFVSLKNILKYDLLQLCSGQLYAFGSEKMLTQMKKLWDSIATKRGN